MVLLEVHLHAETPLACNYSLLVLTTIQPVGPKRYAELLRSVAARCSFRLCCRTYCSASMRACVWRRSCDSCTARCPRHRKHARRIADSASKPSVICVAATAVFAGAPCSAQQRNRQAQRCCQRPFAVLRATRLPKCAVAARQQQQRRQCWGKQRAGKPSSTGTAAACVCRTGRRPQGQTISAEVHEARRGAPGVR